MSLFFALLVGAARNEKSPSEHAMPPRALHLCVPGVAQRFFQGYYLDEEANWGLDIAELERSFASGAEEGLKIRALAVINPGNPVGNCLSEANMRDIVHFCVDKGIVLLADEVYQANLYNLGKPFHSFKSIAAQEDKLHSLELMSFHSVSKGFFGECGRRGGYIETSNIDQAARTALYRMMALGLCANIAGQVTIALMVDPPQKGDESFALYDKVSSMVVLSMPHWLKLAPVIDCCPTTVGSSLPVERTHCASDCRVSSYS